MNSLFTCGFGHSDQGEKTTSSVSHPKHRSVACSSHRTTEPLCVGGAGVRSFFDLREKIFLSRNTRGLSSHRGSSFWKWLGWPSDQCRLSIFLWDGQSSSPKTHSLFWDFSHSDQGEKKLPRLPHIQSIGLWSTYLTKLWYHFVWMKQRLGVFSIYIQRSFLKPEYRVPGTADRVFSFHFTNQIKTWVRRWITSFLTPKHTGVVGSVVQMRRPERTCGTTQPTTVSNKQARSPTRRRPGVQEDETEGVRCVGVQVRAWGHGKVEGLEALSSTTKLPAQRR
jgi:hypothetical protein